MVENPVARQWRKQTNKNSHHGRHFFFFKFKPKTFVRRSRGLTVIRLDSTHILHSIEAKGPFFPPPCNKNMYHYGLRCFSLTLFGLRRENFNFFARTADSNLPNGCLNLFKVDIFRKWRKIRHCTYPNFYKKAP